MTQSPPVEIINYHCDICKSQIDKETYEFSIKIFDKALCLNHQGNKHPRDLFVALKKRDVPCEFEAYDGYKFVDIAIHDIKLYIEVGETLNTSNPKQFLEDLKQDKFSSQGGYQTRRINTESIEKYLDEIVDTLKEIYENVKKDIG
jgi:very-short-patch-repair endonuclease